MSRQRPEALHLAVIQLVVCGLEGLVSQPSPPTGRGPNILYILVHGKSSQNGDKNVQILNEDLDYSTAVSHSSSV